MNKQLSETFSSVIKIAASDLVGKEINHELQHTIESDLESCSKLICDYEDETLTISIDSLTGDCIVSCFFYTLGVTDPEKAELENIISHVARFTCSKASDMSGKPTDFAEMRFIYPKLFK